MLRPNVGVRAFQGRGATFRILSVPCIPLVMANTHSRKSIGIAHHFALCHCPALLALSLALVAFCFLAPIWGPQLRPEDFRCHHIWDFIFRTMSFQIQTLTINQEVALQWSCSSWVFDLHNFWAWHILQVALHKNQATGGLKQPPLKLRVTWGEKIRWENPVLWVPNVKPWPSAGPRHYGLWWCDTTRQLSALIFLDLVQYSFGCKAALSHYDI